MKTKRGDKKLKIGNYSFYKIKGFVLNGDIDCEDCLYIENDKTGEGIHLFLHEIKDMMSDNL